MYLAYKNPTSASFEENSWFYVKFEENPWVFACLEICGRKYIRPRKPKSKLFRCSGPESEKPKEEDFVHGKEKETNICKFYVGIRKFLKFFQPPLTMIVMY